MSFARHRAVALLGAAVASLLLLGCRLERPPNPAASADSTAVGRALALSAVPRLTPGRSAELRVDASRIGGVFASTFERELAPAVTFARGSGQPSEVIIVTVDSLAMALDSATAVVRDTSPTSTTTLRVRMVPRVEGGWRVLSEEVLRHMDLGQPAAEKSQGRSQPKVGRGQPKAR